MTKTLLFSKMIQCQICREKLEEMQNFEIMVYHLWKEHQKISNDQEIGNFFRQCET
jgi:hypothetical protein